MIAGLDVGGPDAHASISSGVALVALPWGVVTTIGPVCAPAPTVATVASPDVDLGY